MQKTKRKLSLSIETIRRLDPGQLHGVGGGIVGGDLVIHDTMQNSCNGHSCDPSCNGLCVVTKPR